MPSDVLPDDATRSSSTDSSGTFSYGSVMKWVAPDRSRRFFCGGGHTFWEILRHGRVAVSDEPAYVNDDSRRPDQRISDGCDSRSERRRTHTVIDFVVIDRRRKSADNRMWIVLSVTPMWRNVDPLSCTVDCLGLCRIGEYATRRLLVLSGGVVADCS